MRIVIFGAGNTGAKLVANIFNSIVKDEIALVVDNDKEKYGKEISKGYFVSNPERIRDADFDFIVIASIYVQEIKGQLLKYNLGNRIILVSEYYRNLYSRIKYFERYDNKQSTNHKVFSEKIVVYTAITGDYDTLQSPTFFNDDIKYFCFTNNKKIRSDKWNVIYIDDEKLNNMMLAKKVKMFPDLYLPDNVTSVWVDGKFQVVGNLIEYIKRYERSSPILCFPHFARSCIYDEAARCVTDGIGNKKEIIHQIAEYERNNYPHDNGLYEMGCIVRNHNNPKVKELMNNWWLEVKNHSYRDQISFPYVCWKNNFKPDICDQDLYNNQWLLCTRNYSKDMRK